MHDRLVGGLVDSIHKGALLILDEVTKGGTTTFLSHGLIETQGGADVTERSLDLILGKLQEGSDLGRGRLFAGDVCHHAASLAKLADNLVHVHGDTDGARLVLNGPADGLTDPVHGIGGEADTLGAIELLDGTHESDVPFLNERHEVEAELMGTALVLLRHVDDQAKVSFDHGVTSLLGLGVIGILSDSSESHLILCGEEVSGEESEVGVSGGLRLRHAFIITSGD